MKIISRLSLSVAAFAALLCASTPGVASILLTAEDFTLLGGTDVTSTSATVINGGNVGTSGEAHDVFGFPPGQILGGYGIVPTGPATAQAMDDLITLQNGLAAMEADETLTVLGGLTLLPGVYNIAAETNLTGELILDGNFQNDAFWVFQIGTTLTTAANSKVTIINPGTNDGSDYGVFWSAGAAINFGAGSDLLGNYLSGTTITIGALASGSGRMLAQAAINLDSNDIHAFGGPDGGDWSGGLMYNESGAIVPIPEPATYATTFGLVILGIVFARRLRSRRNT